MLYKRNPQLNQHGELVHLLSVEGLPKSILTHILDTAANFVSVNDREVKKVPLLRGKLRKSLRSSPHPWPSRVWPPWLVPLQRAQRAPA